MYDLIFIILAILYLPYGMVRGKLKGHFLNRSGIRKDKALDKLAGKKVIWMHAVSVGEVLSTRAFLNKLKEKLNDYEIFITTTTATGNLMAKNLGIGTVSYTPLDFSFIVRKFIKKVNPKIFIFAETEIWPNLIAELHKKNIPMFMVGGRISPRSFKGYKRIKFLIRPILRKINLFCMQTKDDAKRIISLGAKEDSVKVMGNMKFDVAEPDINSQEFARKQDFLKHKIDLRKGDLLLVAASTHNPEEKIIIGIYKELKKEFPNLKLLIAPRHIERAKEIKQIFTEQGIKVCLYSENVKSQDLVSENIIIDIMGELKCAYSLATVVFVGGSLIKHGGQNIIEPAFFSKLIIVGPHTFNFKDIVDTFLSGGALIQVKNQTKLRETLKILLRNHSRREALGGNAKKLVDSNSGVSEKIALMLEAFIEKNEKI